MTHRMHQSDVDRSISQFSFPVILRPKAEESVIPVLYSLDQDGLLLAHIDVEQIFSRHRVVDRPWSTRCSGDPFKISLPRLE